MNFLVRLNHLIRFFLLCGLLLVVDGIVPHNTSEAATASFGPGVTGGGDSCEQQIARSYSVLTKLFSNGRIDLSNLGVNQSSAMTVLSKVSFKFEENIEKDGRPVEMLNVFGDNIIIVDRKICNTSREPLGTFTPLLLHEVIRLMGLDDGVDYHISNTYQAVIRRAVAVELGTTHKFLIFPDQIRGRLALAWGLDNEDLDFDALAEKPLNEQSAFLENNKDHVVNYLVYIPTLKVLSVVRDANSVNHPVAYLDGLFYSLGNSIQLVYNELSNIGFIISINDNNTQFVETIFAFEKREEGPAHIYGLCRKNCDSLIRESANQSLTEEQRTLLAKYPRQSIDIWSVKQATPDGYLTHRIAIESYDSISSREKVSLGTDLSIHFDVVTGTFVIKTGSFSPLGLYHK